MGPFSSHMFVIVAKRHFEGVGRRAGKGERTACHVENTAGKAGSGGEGRTGILIFFSQASRL